jgi:Calcineurin-like phosphoesterase
MRCRIWSLWLLLAMGSCGDDLSLREDRGRESWSIVMLPDTQYYALAYPQVFASQLAWIASSAEPLNLQFVVHVGDVTETDAAKEWQVARRSFNLIQNVVPYAIAPGNHDYQGGAVRRSHLTDWFPEEELRRQPTFGGLFEPGSIDNSYQRFTVNDEHWLVLALEWGPRDQVLEWANRIVREHPDDQVIVLTHAYLYNDNTRYDWAARGATQRSSPHAYDADGRWPALSGRSELNDGQQIWDKLITHHRNIRLVLCGHVPRNGVGRLTSETSRGTRVHQLLADYQDRLIGGGGYLRILRFFPDEIEVRTYSPFLDRELFEPAHQFTLPR